MPRTITITFEDGTSHVYQNAPDTITPQDVQARAQQEFGKGVKAIDGGRNASASPMTRTDKVLQGMKDPISGGAQLLTKMLPDSVVSAGNDLNNWLADKTGLVGKLPSGGVDQQVREQEVAYQAQRKAAGETGFDGYRTIGNIVSPANLALASKLPQAATTAGRIGVGVAGGLATGATSPVTEGDFWVEKGKQVAWGGVFGGAVPAVASGISRVISPNASVNPQLAMLKKEGVRPTVGQTLGGWANAVEEKAQSLPLVGDAITSARSKARDQFNNAAINRATREVGVKVSGTGNAAVREAGDEIGKVYEAGKAALGNFAIDQQASTELAQLRRMVAALPKKEQYQFQLIDRIFKNELSPQGHLLADGFKKLDSKLGAEASKFSGSSDAYQKSLGEAVAEMQRIITENAKRANPNAAEMLNKADKAWANLVRIEGAATAAKGTEGVFTPGQLMSAVRGADKSVRDRATARGTATMQDLANAGQRVLGNKIPDSGTAPRLMWGGLGAAAYAAPVTTGLGVAGGLTAYSAPAQWLLRHLASTRPNSAQPIAETVRQVSPYLIPAGSQAGLGLLN